MILARIVGTVVATRKDERLVSHKLLVAQPVDPDGADRGARRSSPSTPSMRASAIPCWSSPAARRAWPPTSRRRPSTRPWSASSTRSTSPHAEEPMQLARVVGSVVATRKHEALRGPALLLVQPIDGAGAGQGGGVAGRRRRAGGGRRPGPAGHGSPRRRRRAPPPRRARRGGDRRRRRPGRYRLASRGLPKHEQRRHSGRRGRCDSTSPGDSHAPSPSPAPARPGACAPAPPGHPSHARFTVLDGAASGGRCVIEPAVTCIHCGHCQTQGY